MKYKIAKLKPFYKKSLKTDPKKPIYLSPPVPEKKEREMNFQNEDYLNK